MASSETSWWLDPSGIVLQVRNVELQSSLAVSAFRLEPDGPRANSAAPLRKRRASDEGLDGDLRNRPPGNDSSRERTDDTTCYNSNSSTALQEVLLPAGHHLLAAGVLSTQAYCNDAGPGRSWAAQPQSVVVTLAGTPGSTLVSSSGASICAWVVHVHKALGGQAPAAAGREPAAASYVAGAEDADGGAVRPPVRPNDVQVEVTGISVEQVACVRGLDVGSPGAGAAGGGRGAVGQGRGPESVHCVLAADGPWAAVLMPPHRVVLLDLSQALQPGSVGPGLHVDMSGGVSGRAAAGDGTAATEAGAAVHARVSSRGPRSGTGGASEAGTAGCWDVELGPAAAAAWGSGGFSGSGGQRGSGRPCSDEPGALQLLGCQLCSGCGSLTLDLAATAGFQRHHHHHRHSQSHLHHQAEEDGEPTPAEAGPGLLRVSFNHMTAAAAVNCSSGRSTEAISRDAGGSAAVWIAASLALEGEATCTCPVRGARLPLATSCCAADPPAPGDTAARTHAVCGGGQGRGASCCMGSAVVVGSSTGLVQLLLPHEHLTPVYPHAPAGQQLNQGSAALTTEGDGRDPQQHRNTHSGTQLPRGHRTRLPGPVASLVSLPQLSLRAPWVTQGRHVAPHTPGHSGTGIGGAAAEGSVGRTDVVAALCSDAEQSLVLMGVSMPAHGSCGRGHMGMGGAVVASSHCTLQQLRRLTGVGLLLPVCLPSAVTLSVAGQDPGGAWADAVLVSAGALAVMAGGASSGGERVLGGRRGIGGEVVEDDGDVFMGEGSDGSGSDGDVVVPPRQRAGRFQQQQQRQQQLGYGRGAGVHAEEEELGGDGGGGQQQAHGEGDAGLQGCGDLAVGPVRLGPWRQGVVLLPAAVQPLPPQCLLDERFTCLTLTSSSGGQLEAGAGRGAVGEADGMHHGQGEQQQGQEGGWDGDSDGEAEAGMQRLVAHMASRWDAGVQRAHEQRAALSRMVQLTEASERDLAAQGLMGAGAGGAEPGMTGSSGPRGSKGGSVGCAGIAGWRAGLAASLPPCRDAMLRGHAMAAETGGAGAVAGGVATVEGGAPAAGCVSGPGPHLRLELVAAVQGCRGGLWVVQAVVSVQQAAVGVPQTAAGVLPPSAPASGPQPPGYPPPLQLLDAALLLHYLPAPGVEAGTSAAPTGAALGAEGGSGCPLLLPPLPCVVSQWQMLDAEGGRVVVEAGLPVVHMLQLAAALQQQQTGGRALSSRGRGGAEPEEGAALLAAALGPIPSLLEPCWPSGAARGLSTAGCTVGSGGGSGHAGGIGCRDGGNSVGSNCNGGYAGGGAEVQLRLGAVLRVTARPERPGRLMPRRQQQQSAGPGGSGGGGQGAGQDGATELVGLLDLGSVWVNTHDLLGQQQGGIASGSWAPGDGFQPIGAAAAPGGAGMRPLRPGCEVVMSCAESRGRGGVQDCPWAPGELLLPPGRCMLLRAVQAQEAEAGGAVQWQPSGAEGDDPRGGGVMRGAPSAASGHKGLCSGLLHELLGSPGFSIAPGEGPGQGRGPGPGRERGGNIASTGATCLWMGPASLGAPVVEVSLREAGTCACSCEVLLAVHPHSVAAGGAAGWGGLRAAAAAALEAAQAAVQAAAARCCAKAGQQLQCTNAWDFSPHHLRGGRSAVRRATVSAPVPDFHATAAAPAATVKQEPTARGEPPRASHVSPPPSYPQPQLAPPLPHKAGLQAAGDMSGLQAAGDALSRCVDATLELLEGAARLRQQQQQQKPGAGAAALPGAGHQRRAGSGQGAEDEEAAGRISGKELQTALRQVAQLQLQLSNAMAGLAWG